jgi:hypothetical protein
VCTLAAVRLEHIGKGPEVREAFITNAVRAEKIREAAEVYKRKMPKSLSKLVAQLRKVQEFPETTSVEDIKAASTAIQRQIAKIADLQNRSAELAGDPDATIRVQERRGSDGGATDVAKTPSPRKRQLPLFTNRGFELEDTELAEFYNQVITHVNEVTKQEKQAVVGQAD